MTVGKITSVFCFHLKQQNKKKATKSKPPAGIKWTENAHLEGSK